jgi:hypothetical protein
MGLASPRKNCPRLPNLGRPFYPVYLLEENKTIVKTGKTIRAMTEVDTMRFVREHTTVLVPECTYSVYKYEESGAVRIAMEYTQGMNLGGAWETLAGDEKESVVRKLHGYFKELR